MPRPGVRVPVWALSVPVLVAGLAWAPPAAAADVPIELEAENATLSGGAGVNDNHLGYSGTGFVDGFVQEHRGAAAVTFDLDVPQAGQYGLNVRYANGLGSDMTLSQVVGDEDRQIVLSSAPGASWSRWFVHQEQVTLAAGPQQVTFRFDDDDTGNVNIDAIALTTVGDLSTPGGGATDPGQVPGTGPDTRWDDVTTALRTVPAPRGGASYQAEDAFHASGATVVQDATGAGVDLAAERARLVVTTFASTAGRQKVALRYRNAADAAVTLVVGVDGLPVGTLTLPPSSAWQDLAVPLTLRQGLGTVELRRTGGGAATGPVVVDSVRAQHGEQPAARGATTGTVVHEAEHGLTTGQVLPASRQFREIAAEASGRQAVTLTERRQYVEWTLTEPADALVLRASIPDTADGVGQDTTLGLYAGGRKIADVPVSSRYSWVYGGYPYGNRPADGGAQRFFDESRATFATLPAGTVLRLQKDGASADLPFTVDLVETEVRAPERTEPTGYLDVRDFGATADDGTDDTDAVQAAVDAAREAGTGVWVPRGRFTLTGVVRLVDVSVRGAGPWYSVLEGRDGKGGLYAMGSGITVTDLTVDGDVRYRDDRLFDSGIEGNFGQGSLLQDVWVTHTKTGVWLDAGTDGLYAVGVRVRDTFADGVHLHGAVTDTRVEHASVRSTGDDGMAMWSLGGPVTRSSFVRSTVQSPLLGNGAAVYGGDSNAVSGLVVADTLTAPAGVAVSTRFNPVPFTGTTVVEDTDIHRSGGWEPNWSTSFGGIWVFADTSAITTPVVVRDTRIIDSTYEGLLVSGAHPVSDLRLEDVTIEGTGSYAVAARVGGQHAFTDVRVSGVREPSDGRNHLWGTVVDGGGNTGLFTAEKASCAVTYRAPRVVAGRYVATVRLTNTGTSTLPAGSLAWHAGSGESVRSLSGATITQNGTRVQADLGTQLRPGRSASFTVTGTANANRTVAPSAYVLDGVACAAP